MLWSIFLERNFFYTSLITKPTVKLPPAFIALDASQLRELSYFNSQKRILNESILIQWNSNKIYGIPCEYCNSFLRSMPQNVSKFSGAKSYNCSQFILLSFNASNCNTFLKTYLQSLRSTCFKARKFCLNYVNSRTTLMLKTKATLK